MVENSVVCFFFALCKDFTLKTTKKLLFGKLNFKIIAYNEYCFLIRIIWMEIHGVMYIRYTITMEFFMFTEYTYTN